MTDALLLAKIDKLEKQLWKRHNLPYCGRPFQEHLLRWIHMGRVPEDELVQEWLALYTTWNHRERKS